MKNQYFGDINDYRKYGLLRILSNGGSMKIGVCWMLTADDGRPDGGHTHYLEEPEKWRKYDPDLFDLLKKTVRGAGVRDVRQLECTGILPAALFYAQLLTDCPAERHNYFAEMLRRFEDVDLIFFDPDNGLGVKSTSLGRKDSCKYLYWHEVHSAFGRDHSLLVYQHFPREEHEPFIQKIARHIRCHLGGPTVHWFRTPHVVFFLAAQPNHVGRFGQQAGEVARVWATQIDTGPLASTQ